MQNTDFPSPGERLRPQTLTKCELGAKEGQNRIVPSGQLCSAGSMPKKVQTEIVPVAGYGVYPGWNKKGEYPPVGDQGNASRGKRKNPA